MKAIKVFSFFAIVLAGNLALVESIRNASAVSRPATVSPQPSIVQVRSIAPGNATKLNSTGFMLSQQWVVASAEMIHNVPSPTIWLYYGSCVYNELNNTRKGILTPDMIVGAIALIKNDRPVSHTAFISSGALAPDATYYGYAAKIIGYGPGDMNAIKKFSTIRREALGTIQAPVETNTQVLDFGLQDPNAKCVDKYDAGSPIFVQINNVYHCVGITYLEYVDCDVETSPNTLIGAFYLYPYMSFIKNATST